MWSGIKHIQAALKSSNPWPDSWIIDHLSRTGTCLDSSMSDSACQRQMGIYKTVDTGQLL
jgi:hypothetical protein